MHGARGALVSAQSLASELAAARDQLASTGAMATELADVREQLAAAHANASLHAAQASEAMARDDADDLASLRLRLERLDALGIDVDAIPELLDAARRLTALEQDEVPAMLARAETQRQEQETALRDELTAAASERERATGALADVAQRVAELESSLADAWAQKLALEDDDPRRTHHARSACDGDGARRACPTNTAGSSRTSRMSASCIPRTMAGFSRPMLTPPACAATPRRSR